MADFRIRWYEVISVTVHDMICIQPTGTGEITRSTAVRRHVVSERALVQIVDGQQRLLFLTPRVLLEALRVAGMLHGLQIVSMSIREFGPSGIQLIG